MTRIFQLCSALLLAALSAGSQAANYAGTTFEIEMIVFSRTQGMEQARETWPAAPRLEYPRNWVDFNSQNGESPRLFPVANQLDNKAAALNRGGYRVLFHRSWQQVLQQKRNAPAILVSGGNTVGGLGELEGSVTLSVSRYLHLSTNLWFTEFAPRQDAGAILLPRKPQAPVSESTDEPMGFGSTAASALPALQPAQVFASHVAPLKQERRMRSGELHYLDHPKFGVLIQVRTVEQPESDIDSAG